MCYIYSSYIRSGSIDNNYKILFYGVGESVCRSNCTSVNTADGSINEKSNGVNCIDVNDFSEKQKSYDA